VQVIISLESLVSTPQRDPIQGRRWTRPSLGLSSNDDWDSAQCKISISKFGWSAFSAFQLVNYGVTKSSMSTLY
jgi:hypothetical protein